MAVQLGGITVSNPLATTSKTAYPTAPPVSTANGAYPTIASTTWHAPMLPAGGSPAPAAKPAATTYSSPAAVTSGGGGASVAAAPQYVDPYANTVFGSTANYNRVQGDWNTQRDNTLSSINDRVGNDAATYHSGILDYIDNLKSGQSKIDAQAVQNELARMQGVAGVMGTVGRGLRSGGVTLANKNATTSSAAEALAAAYADIGQRELTGVDNQYETGKYNIGLSQADLDAQAATGMRHMNENKNNIVNGIVSDAQSAIASLNQAAASASLPDRLDIEAKKTEIRNQAMARLQAFDGELAGAKPAAASVDANRAQANQLETAGNTAANPFQFTAALPAQFQNTGPFASELPLFSLPTNKKQTA